MLEPKCLPLAGSSFSHPCALRSRLTCERGGDNEETTDAHRGRHRCALVLAGAGSTALGQGQTSEAARQPVRLAAATLIIEVNGTDGDAGLQFFLDGDPWNSMKISDPNGKVVADVDAEGRLKNWGLTELFSESNEPPFSEVPLAEFKARFPEGKYTFVGETIEGEKLVGTARLSHDIPRWQAPPEPAGIDISG